MPASRQILLNLLDAALRAVAGRRAVQAYFAAQPWRGGALRVVAIGKAAASMAAGAEDALGETIRQGLVITRYGHLQQVALASCWQCLEAGHPVPDANSLRAGQSLLEFVAAVPEEEGLLFLLSGGSSALVEVLPPGVELADLARFNQWFLGSGLDIASGNRLRKALSCIKGGRLWPAIRAERVVSLLISDVPGDDPAVIGSGLLTPSADATVPAVDLPEWLQGLLQQAQYNQPNAIRVPQGFVQAIIANNELACRAAAGQARLLGLPARIHSPLFSDVALVAQQVLAQLRADPHGIHIWGAESTVRLPSTPGQGGRNQHLALLLARELAGREDISVLCAATDGSDGPGEDAGALIDGQTLQRGIDYPGGAQAALRQADAGRFLAEAGDLLTTGPTGSNVMDLIISYGYGEAAAETELDAE